VTRPKRTCNAQSLQQNADEDGLKPTLELYGEWQLEPLQLPHAVDGIVPKVLLAHFSITHHLEHYLLVFLCFVLINAKMSPRMNVAKSMYGQRSASHLVQCT
jgi:hypothetical protein